MAAAVELLPFSPDRLATDTVNIVKSRFPLPPL